MDNVLFSSKSGNWSTPNYLFRSLDEEFCFTLDPCSDLDNHKCSKFYTIEDNGLLQDWSGERVFCNPPYSRSLGRWVEKCYWESLKPDTLVVMLIPARTDTRWFHEYIYMKDNVEIRFLRGRLKFGGSDKDAPFPSMIVVFGKRVDAT